MNTPDHSLAYKLAKWRISRRPWKYLAVLLLGVSLAMFALALWDDHRRTSTVILAVMFLFNAYNEWELIGFREIVDEQAKLLDEARSKKNS